jgi:hypothetical protein
MNPGAAARAPTVAPGGACRSPHSCSPSSARSVGPVTEPGPAALPAYCLDGPAGEQSEVSGELLLVTFAEAAPNNAALRRHHRPRCVQSIHPIGIRNERASLFPVGRGAQLRGDVIRPPRAAACADECGRSASGLGSYLAPGRDAPARPYGCASFAPPEIALVRSPASSAAALVGQAAGSPWRSGAPARAV